jgi:long-chain acyl-CoA synthetase
VSLQVLPGDTTLSLLPPWHIYQRTVSYYLLSVGCQEVFSSIRSFAKDLTAYPPDHFICVPLVLDTLYNKVGHTHTARAAAADRCPSTCGRLWDM